jgi:hypothetical protein
MTGKHKYVCYQYMRIGINNGIANCYILNYVLPQLLYLQIYAGLGQYAYRMSAIIFKFV